MVYPFLSEQGMLLKKQLIKSKIFVATYWPNVMEWTAPNSFESSLANNLIPLPLDQRYSHKDMERTIKLLKEK